MRIRVRICFVFHVGSCLFLPFCHHYHHPEPCWWLSFVLFFACLLFSSCLFVSFSLVLSSENIPGCRWFLDYISSSPALVVDFALECRDRAVRSAFTEIVLMCIRAVAPHEEPFYDQEDEKQKKQDQEEKKGTPSSSRPRGASSSINIKSSKASSIRVLGLFSCWLCLLACLSVCLFVCSFVRLFVCLFVPVGCCSALCLLLSYSRLCLYASFATRTVLLLFFELFSEANWISRSKKQIESYEFKFLTTLTSWRRWHCIFFLHWIICLLVKPVHALTPLVNGLWGSLLLSEPSRITYVPLAIRGLTIASCYGLIVQSHRKNGVWKCVTLSWFYQHQWCCPRDTLFSLRAELRCGPTDDNQIQTLEQPSPVWLKSSNSNHWCSIIECFNGPSVVILFHQLSLVSSGV